MERIELWEREELPPRAIASDDDEESVISNPESAYSETSRVKTGRPSLLLTTCRGTGIEMDVANKAANTMLLQGKEALEQATTMKKECKLTALDALQSLYETVLSLSDSRSRHKFNLEKERSRHAQELVRVERAHTKTIAALTQELLKTKEQTSAALKEIQDVRKWLEFETAEPHRQIKELVRANKMLELNITSIKDQIAAHQRSDGGSQDLEPMKSKVDTIASSVKTLQTQLDELRQGVAKVDSKAAAINKDLTRHVDNQTLLSPSTLPTKVEEDIKELKTAFNTLKDAVNKAHTTPQQPPRVEIGEQLKPITERLKVVSSELKTIREQKSEAPPQQPSLNLGAEIALAEMIKTQASATKSYAQAAAKPPPPRRPNHSLIVSSNDKNNTGDNVISLIRSVLDPKNTGARVERVKKVKNQKVIISCANKEDLNLIRTRIKTSKDLKTEIARSTNPQVIIRDVLAYHTDAEIVEHILAQNPAIIKGIEQNERIIRVRYRKRARNNLECHPVLEVSPPIHKNMLEAEKLYIDLQRRPVADHSPLVQCTKCLGFGHTKALCQEKEGICSHCGKPHTWEKCPARLENKPPSCINCTNNTKAQGQPPPNATHNAFSNECPERQKWDAIARAKVSYLC